MQRVLVMCAAGASSTFLVHWMRKGAAERGLDIVIDAGSQDDLSRQLPDVNAVLVGAHLREAFPQLSAIARAAGVPALLLPVAGFGAVGASEALGLLEELLATSENSQAAVTDHSAVAGGRDNSGSHHG